VRTFPGQIKKKKMLDNSWLTAEERARPAKGGRSRKVVEKLDCVVVQAKNQEIRYAGWGAEQTDTHA